MEVGLIKRLTELSCQLRVHVVDTGMDVKIYSLTHWFVRES